jgi:rare lipoprotein A
MRSLLRPSTHKFGKVKRTTKDISLDALSYRLCLIILILLSAACATTPPPPKTKTSIPYDVGGKRYYPIPSSSGFAQRGLASWYGPKFHGRTTANGEHYDMYGYTAAHKTLPFNTHVQVTNLENNKSTVVRINDRGPFVKGRIIDLTYAAAHALDMAEDGVVQVRIEALGYAREKSRAGELVREYTKPASYQLGDFTIQVGAFVQEENARRLHASLNRSYQRATVNILDRGAQRFYRVRVGKYSSLDQAQEAAGQLQQQGFSNAFVVAWD